RGGGAGLRIGYSRTLGDARVYPEGPAAVARAAARPAPARRSSALAGRAAALDAVRAPAARGGRVLGICN
ncbi:hypothetical protein CCS92_33610, partial [Methylobacterium radiotolerans]